MSVINPSSQHPHHKSFCSEHLMYFVNEYHMEDYPVGEEVVLGLHRFHEKCIVGPLEVLSFAVVKPTIAHEVEKMIVSYNWYITNRFWCFQLLYPVVSFLRIYHSILLINSDLQFCEDLLRNYVGTLEEEAM